MSGGAGTVDSSFLEDVNMCPTRLIALLLMTWRRKESGHQQLWFYTWQDILVLAHFFNFQYVRKHI